VDDNATSLQVLTAALRNLGHEAHGCDSADRALQLLAEAAQAGRAYAVMLLDASLPNTDAVQFAQSIVGDPRLCATRLILMTPVSSGDAKALARGGFAGGLAKPLRTSQLAASLEQLLMPESVRSAHGSGAPVRSNNVVAPELVRGARVLVVEDNVINQKVAARFLERLGCQVSIAKDGEEGAAACRPGAFDLVLMDVQMPVLDGYAATRRIREQELDTSYRVPILALTADAMSGQAELCAAAGMDGLLTKPIQLDQLHRALGQHLLELPALKAAVG
jgi:CheY-like chemotaxis protein